MLKYCALCRSDLTEDNSTEEHLILNAIGGKKTVKDFICNACNQKTGREWDNHLAEQLLALCRLFDIKRDRGNSPNMIISTTKGQSFNWNSDNSFTDRKPTFKETVNENKVEISVKARTIDEAKKILKGIGRKYPQTDIEERIKNLSLSSNPFQEETQFELNIGGPQCGRSIIKSLTGLAVSHGINPDNCPLSISYLTSESAPACFGFYYETDLIQNREKGEPIHCLYVTGNPENKMILGYAEIFGFHRIVACLSDTYTGNFFDYCYALNPKTGNTITPKINLNFSKEDILKIYNYEKFDNTAIVEIIDSLLKNAPALKRKSAIEGLILHAYTSAISILGIMPDEELTTDQIQSFYEVYSKELYSLISNIDSKSQQLQ